MLHKPQTRFSPNLIFADVLNNSYMHKIYIFKKWKKIPHCEKYKVKGQIWRPWMHNCAEYIGVIGHWKEHFISFEMSIKWALYLNSGRSYATFSKTTCAKKNLFFINLGVCCQSHKKSLSSEGVGLWPVLILHGMTHPLKTVIFILIAMRTWNLIFTYLLFSWDLILS
jgi:hypothetical protein